MQLKFGTGSLYGVNTAANSTPVRFGGLQDVNVDISFTAKELFGQYQFPIAIARGEGKITGKAKFAQIDGVIYNDLFFGSTMASGQTVGAEDEAASIPSTTPWTVTAANAATFVEDWGVTYAATGIAFTRVAAGSEATGSYSVDPSTGVYTFSTGDSGVDVKLNYSYTVTGSGYTLSVTNQLQGASPFFIARFNTTYNSQQYYLELKRCMASKLTVASKMSDWNIDEFDFSAFADAAGDVMTVGLAE